MKITDRQIKTIHSLLAVKGLKDEKQAIIKQASATGCTSTKDLTFTEAARLISSLSNNSNSTSQQSRLMSKLFAMAFEMGWVITTNQVDGNGNIKPKKDYSHVHAWVEKYGYLKKPLREYAYKELPKLVTQFELGPYSDFINKLK